MKAIFPFVPGNVPELTGFVRTADTITSTMADSVIDMAVTGRKIPEFSCLRSFALELFLDDNFSSHAWVYDT